MLKKKNLWRGLTMVFALLLAVSMMAGNTWSSTAPLWMPSWAPAAPRL